MQAAAHTGAAAPDSFDMSALKAALGGRGGCQPPSHTVRDHAASEQHEGAERDEGAAAAGAEVGAASPVGSGDGGKDGRGGDDKAGEPARPPAAWRVEVPSDEKENLDPVGLRPPAPAPAPAAGVCASSAPRSAMADVRLSSPAPRV